MDDLGRAKSGPTWHPGEWNIGVRAGESVEQGDPRERGTQEATGGGIVGILGRRWRPGAQRPSSGVTAGSEEGTARVSGFDHPRRYAGLTVLFETGNGESGFKVVERAQVDTLFF